MKRVFYILLAFASIANCSVSYATEIIKTVTIVNHYDKPLLFTITDHHEIVPDFKDTFTLQPNERKVSSVRAGPEGANEAYISIDGIQGDPVYAFMGVDNIAIRGYVDPVPGLAFSYTSELMSKIIFCTSDYYSAHGNHC